MFLSRNCVLIAAVALLSLGCSANSQSESRRDSGTAKGAKALVSVEGSFAAVSLEKFVSVSPIIAEVVVERIDEPRAIRDNPNLPAQLEEGSEEFFDSLYRDVIVRVVTRIRATTNGQLIPIRSLVAGGEIAVGGHESGWTPEVAKRYVIFGFEGPDIWSGGVLLKGPDAAPEVTMETVTFNHVVQPPRTVSISELKQIAGGQLIKSASAPATRVGSVCCSGGACGCSCS